MIRMHIPTTQPIGIAIIVLTISTTLHGNDDPPPEDPKPKSERGEPQKNEGDPPSDSAPKSDPRNDEQSSLEAENPGEEQNHHPDGEADQGFKGVELPDEATNDPTANDDPGVIEPEPTPMQPDTPSQTPQSPSASPQQPENQYEPTQPTPQDQPIQSPPPTGDSNMSPSPPAPEPPVPASKKRTPEFASVSLSPQMGYTFYPKSEMEIRGFKATVEPRHGLIFKLHLDLGGDGVAFELAPIFSLQFGGITPNSSISDINFESGFSSGSFQAVGGEMGLVYRFSIKQFFPHFGFGFHGAYLRGDDIEYGVEIYGRIPVGLTVYLAQHIAVVAEFGFMLGVTGIRAIPKLDGILATMPPELQESLEDVDTQAEFEAWYTENQADVDAWIVDNEEDLPEGYDSSQMAQDMVSSQLAKAIRFGRGFGLDFLIGIRFP